MSTKEAVVCIVIPAYNAGSVIERCLNSLQMQTYARWKAVVIDDGSKDDTGAKIARYAVEDPRIFSVNGKHSGVSAARNLGLDEAEKFEPDFITFLDSDDYLEPEALEEMLECAQRTGADIVHCKYFSEYVNGFRFEPAHLFPEDSVFEAEDFPKTVFWKMMTGIQMNHICTKLYRAELIRGVRLETKLRTCEDLMMNIVLFSKAKSYAYLAKPLYHYIRDIADSLTNSGLSGKIKLGSNWEVSKEMLRRLPQWQMNTAWYKLCVVARPIVLVYSKLYRSAIAKWNRLLRGDRTTMTNAG